LDLARRYPEADFVWYGEGELRRPLADEAARRGLRNLSFAGPLAPSALAEAFRKAEILVLPSLSEGVPRITHEAAASGLAQVIFGFYEAPTVADGINGTVVWSDEELERRLGELLADRERTRAMGMAGVEMARAWTWSRLAPLWQEAITSSVKHRLAANSSAHLA
jgi:glycosyltransferase involved in cell wall biosynthesis